MGRPRSGRDGIMRGRALLVTNRPAQAGSAYVHQVSFSDGGVPKCAMPAAQVTVNGLTGDRQRFGTGRTGTGASQRHERTLPGEPIRGRAALRLSAKIRPLPYHQCPPDHGIGRTAGREPGIDPPAINNCIGSSVSADCNFMVTDSTSIELKEALSIPGPARHNRCVFRCAAS